MGRVISEQVCKIDRTYLFDIDGRHKLYLYLMRFMFTKAGRKRPETWLTQTMIFVLFTIVWNNTFLRLISFGAQLISFTTVFIELT